MCVESVLDQTYDNFEAVIVTETAHASKHVSEDFADNGKVTHVHSQRSLNLSSARNLGAEQANGDIYAFIDDDAFADSYWLEHIAGAYIKQNPTAVGGKLVASWPDGEPWYLPSEFYWLVGVTHKGFREDPGLVRNTFGANITFRAEVFDELGGFDERFGKDHGHNLQGEETELAARMRDRYGSALYYVPEAIVTHRVYDWQLEWGWLINRAYWQGYTKALLRQTVVDSTDTETAFLRSLLTQSLPRYILNALMQKTVKPLVIAGVLLVLTALVGVGFLVGTAKEYVR